MLGEVAVSSKSPDACTEFQPTQLFTTLYANFARTARLKDRAQARKRLISCVRFLNRKVLMELNESKPWEELYVAAVLENDPAKAADRINTAQDALRERWHALSQVPLARDPERQRVEDAIRTLNLIRLNELEPPA